MRPSLRASVLATAVAATLLLAAPRSAYAASYASGVTQSGNLLTFNLNEDADNVVVYLNGSPTSLGAKSAGAVTFDTAGVTNWQIQVTKYDGLGFAGQLLPGVGGVVQTLADTTSTRFNSPRGVDVNTYTNNLSLFGTVYVSNSAAGTAAADTTNVGAPLPARTLTGDGIYVLDSKLADVLGQANAAKNGGVAFTASTNSPYRVSVGQDNFLYISDWSDAQGSVYRADPTITTTTNALNGTGGPAVAAPTATLNHGSVSGAVASGSLATGDLKIFTVDEDLQEAGGSNQQNSVWRYDVNAGPLPDTAAPVRLASPIINFASQTADIHLARDGKIYVSDNRSDGAESGVVILAQDGSKLWSSFTATGAAGLDADPLLTGTQDVLRRAQGVTVSPDGKFMAVLRATDNAVTVVPIDPGTGLPDLTKLTVFNGFGATTQGRDIAFDAADNLYVVSSGYGALRVFSPGGTSVTTLSSDGTFTTSLTNNQPEWNVDGPGNSSVGSNWSTGAAPGGTGAFARFGAKATSNTAVTLDPSATYGEIVFDNAAASYTLTGSPLTIAATSATFASQGVYASAGSHTVAVPTSFSHATTLGAGPGATLTFTSTLAGGTNALNKIGAGTVVLASLTSGSVNVSDGPLRIASLTTGAITANTSGTLAASVINATTLAARGTTGKIQLLPDAPAASKATSLSTYTTATSGTPPVTTTTWTGFIDLTNGKLVVDYATTSPAADVRNQIAHAYHAGAWDSAGITSSYANSAANDPAHTHAVGYVEASAKYGAAGATWFGQSADATALLLAYTYAGDADLSLGIDGDDFALLDRGFARYAAGTIAANAAVWSDGDFNYDGAVNASDYLILDTTEGKLTGQLSPDLLATREAQFGESYVAALTAAVPEPTSLAACGLALPALLRRRNLR